VEAPVLRVFQGSRCSQGGNPEGACCSNQWQLSCQLGVKTQGGACTASCMQLGHVQRVASIFVKITLPWLDDRGRVVSRDDGEGPCSEARKVDSAALYGSSLRLDSAQIWCRRGLGARGRELSLDGAPPLSCRLLSAGDAASIVLLRWGDAAAVGTWLGPAGAPTLSLLPRRLIPALASSCLAVAGELPPRPR